ncbi:MAG: NAD(P)-binding protein, partial [Pseudomonadales bacterium]|nr:NAD(P)-binding protein [Pseudomonadales bacterium]
MNRNYDIIIIGAGPAGMAAAILCGAYRASTLLLDEQSEPGGQIYRAVENSAISDRDILGPDYYTGAALTKEFRSADIEYKTGTNVWQISTNNDAYKEVVFSKEGVAHIVCARQ